MFFRRSRHPSDGDLSAYLDGRLEDAVRARLEAHLAGCPTCRQALEELRAVRQALRELPRTAAPRSFALREADVRPAPARQPVGGLGRMAPLLSGVTAVALFAFLALVGVDVLGGPLERAEEAPRPAAQGAYEAREEAPAEATVATEFELGAPEEAAPPEEPTAGGETREPLRSGQLAPRATPPAQATPAAAARAAEEEDRTGLRIAEAALAAVALVAGGSLALAWWRRRA